MSDINIHVRNFRNLYTGLGYLASAVIMLGTLGFKNAPRVKATPLPLYTGNKGRKIDTLIERFFTRRVYNRVAFRIHPLGGRYITREGFRVMVRPNTEGFYDKLPFVVEDGRNKYTVCERGWSYPGNDLQRGFFKIGMDVVKEDDGTAPLKWAYKNHQEDFAKIASTIEEL